MGQHVNVLFGQFQIHRSVRLLFGVLFQGNGTCPRTPRGGRYRHAHRPWEIFIESSSEEKRPARGRRALAGIDSPIQHTGLTQGEEGVRLISRGGFSLEKRRPS